MGRLFGIFMLVGAAACFLGYKFYHLSVDSTAEPIEVKLADLENGNIPDNNHWTVTGVKFMQNGLQHDGDLMGNISRANYESFFDRGSLFYIPMVTNQNGKAFSAILLTKRDLGEQLNKLYDRDSVSGLNVTDITSLGQEEISLLSDDYPNTDWDNVIIMQEARKPWPMLWVWGALVGGGILILFGGFMALRSS